ncbi:SpoIIE family protein phosphatase [Streptomyces sp. CWNU-52B]|uniref:SpoIIE family protein phosphatase n=1 Tax=unclassified Streptomyces TaxID=2593676 RepID=UPI0039BF1FC0
MVPPPDGSVSDPVSPAPAHDPLAVALIDPDGRVRLWSAGAQALTGHPAREIIGRDAGVLADRVTTQGGELVRLLVRTADQERAADRGATAGRERTAGRTSGSERASAADGVRAGAGVRTDWVRCFDGTCRSVVWQPFAVPLATGTGVFAIAVPAAQQLHQCDAAAIGHLLSSAPIGLAVLDNELRYRFVNDALARINGLPVAQHLGRRILDVLDVPDPQTYERVLRRIVEDGETVDNLQVAAIGPDGHPYAARGTLFPLRGPDGHIVGQAGLVHEVGHGGGELLDAARDRRRMELLARISAVLGQGLDLGSIATKLAAVCVPEFAHDVTVDLLRAAAQPDSAAGGEGRTPWAGTTPWTHAFTDPPAAAVGHGTDPEADLPPPGLARTPVADCVRTARPAAFRADDEHGLAPYGIAVPLMAVGRVLGAVTFLRHDREFGHEDVLTARDIAARTAIAIDNALLYRRQRLATLTLQRHLLPSGLPGTDWVRSAHRYSPAQDGTLAGGDWYDSILLPGGRIGLNIGDVMGHGLGAAAAMGRYRSSARALLAVGLDPGQLLTRLDGLMDDSEGDLAATCACAVYDGVTGLLHLALAGHPPPLLIRPDGSADILNGEPGPPLGMGLDHVYAGSRHSIPAGSLLVLYTDGMVEDRSAVLDLDQGIAVLSKAVREPGASLDEVCDALMAARPAGSADDAALLVTRLARL